MLSVYSGEVNGESERTAAGSEEEAGGWMDGLMVDVLSSMLLSALAARTSSSVSRVCPPLAGMSPVSCSAMSTARGTAAPSPCSVTNGSRSSISSR